MSSDDSQQPPPPRLLSPLPPLFGLLTPLGGQDDFTAMLGVASPAEPTDENEQVFIPHQTPLRRFGAAYSPLPDDLGPLEPPAQFGGDLARKRKRRQSQKSSRKKRRKRQLRNRVSRTVFSQDREVIIRTKRQYTLSTIDPYYGQRYERVAEIDSRLGKILTVLGSEFFLNKTVIDIACGRCAFIALYIAAYLGASRVVACDSEFDSIMSNLRQLRKFKHDGIRLETSSTSVADQYPPMLVKRSGPVPITNKPWRVLPQYSCAKEPSKNMRENFPFNMEFRMVSAIKTKIENESYDIVLVLGYMMRQAFVTNGANGLRDLFANIRLLSNSQTRILVEIFFWRDVRKHVEKENMMTRVDEFLVSDLGLVIEKRISATLLVFRFKNQLG